jgi:hypothetical protein
MLPPKVAALPPVVDSCGLPVHDIAIMLPPKVAALSPVADSCGLPVHDLAIMSQPNVAVLPSLADSCGLRVHNLAIMSQPNVAALSAVADFCGLPVYDHVPDHFPIQFDNRINCCRARVISSLGQRVISRHDRSRDSPSRHPPSNPQRTYEIEQIP